MQELLKVGEVADMLRCSRHTVARLIRDGRLPALNVAVGSSRSDFRIEPAALKQLKLSIHKPAQPLPSLTTQNEAADEFDRAVR